MDARRKAEFTGAKAVSALGLREGAVSPRHGSKRHKRWRNCVSRDLGRSVWLTEGASVWFGWCPEVGVCLGADEVLGWLWRETGAGEALSRGCVICTVLPHGSGQCVCLEAGRPGRGARAVGSRGLG